MISKRFKKYAPFFTLTLALSFSFPSVAKKIEMPDPLDAHGSRQPRANPGPLEEERHIRSIIECANTGDVEANYLLATFYDTGQGLPENPREAARLYSYCARRNHWDAQNNLAQMYYQGRGVEQSVYKALFWFKKAADHHHAVAQFNLGLYYHQGDKKNYALAAHWYRLACSHGCPQAFMHLGNLYEEGLGVERNMAVAYKLYARASKKGIDGAMVKMAYICLVWGNEETSEKRAIKLLRSAANRGCPNAFLGLAQVYENGCSAFPANLDKALNYYLKAVDHGFSQETLLQKIVDLQNRLKNS